MHNSNRIRYIKVLDNQMRLLVWTDSTRGRVRGHHVLETTSFNTLSRYSEHTNFNQKRFTFYQKYFIVICIVFLYILIKNTYQQGNVTSLKSRKQENCGMWHVACGMRENKKTAACGMWHVA